MADIKMICMRCSGRKKMYKVGGGYTLQNMGGSEVDCPMCLGKGKIDNLDSVKVKEMIKEQQNVVEEKSKAVETKTVSKSRGNCNAKKESRARKA